MNDRVTDVDALIDRCRDEWQLATAGAAFILGVRDGTLAPVAFQRWFAQDRHFIEGLYGAQLRVAALASGETRRMLLDGVVALQQELDWFEEQSERRGITLAGPAVDECLAFVDYLTTLTFASLSVALTTLWAVERSYLDAWSAARPGAVPYREFVAHWSNDGFRDYVARLRIGANEALASASASDQNAAEQSFLRVMAFERRFWRMTESANSG